MEEGIQGADRPPKSAEPTEEGWRRRVPAGLTCSPVGWLAYSSQVSLFQQLQVAPGWEFALSLKIALYIRPTVCDLLVIQANRSQKISDSLEKFDFSSESVFFMSESLFGSQKTANRSKTDELSPNPGQ